MDQKTAERLHYYGDLARRKGYRQETIEMGIMLAHTTVLVEKYGSAEQAFEEVIKICEKHDDGEKFIAEVADLLEMK